MLGKAVPGPVNEQCRQYGVCKGAEGGGGGKNAGDTDKAHKILLLPKSLQSCSQDSLQKNNGFRDLGENAHKSMMRCPGTPMGCRTRSGVSAVLSVDQCPTPSPVAHL